MKKVKPAGIVLIAIYSALSGLLSFGLGSILLLASAVPDMPIWLMFIGVVSVALGVFLLAAVYGLWSLQSWGLKVTKSLYIISIPLGFISIFPIYPDSQMTTGNTILQVVGIVLAIFIIYYLSKPKVASLYSSESF